MCAEHSLAEPSLVYKQTGVSCLEEEKASGFEAYGRHAQRVERVERVGDVESVLVAFSTEFLSFIASILVSSRSRTYGSIPRVFPY